MPRLRIVVEEAGEGEYAHFERKDDTHWVDDDGDPVTGRLARRLTDLQDAILEEMARERGVIRL